MKESKERREKPFEGKKVFFSSSMKGVSSPDEELPWHIVQYILEGGAEVFNEHTVAKTSEERTAVFKEKTGIDRSTLVAPWYVLREADMKWIDEATHLIAIVDGPSHGVGMEIQRALDKSDGKKHILCLIREDLVNELSWMIKGISDKWPYRFSLMEYKNLKDAKEKIHNFLL
jgi:hypothetical protein